MSTEQPWTIGRLLEWTTQYLTQKGIESPRLDTQVLLAQALGCKRIDLYARFEELAPEEDRKQFRELIRRRVEGCPVAYLVGRKEFFLLEFEVNPSVLIPRDDSQCLVDDCLRLLRDRTREGEAPAEPRILDVGTGSGCLAVTVAWKHKTAQVTAIDINPEALAVASRNAARHRVDDRIRFLEGDVYGPLPPGERFDIILSNPPYIRRADLAGLAPTVRNYEPRLALDGGPDGLVVFDRLLAGATEHLEAGGYLLVEIGFDQEPEARRRIEARREFELAPTIRDMGNQPRVLQARRR